MPQEQPLKEEEEEEEKKKNLFLSYSFCFIDLPIFS